MHRAIHHEKHTLSCHCGNVQLSFESMPESVTSCNCSICRRYAALWGYFSPEDVLVTIKKIETKAYRWGDGYIDFQHCSICGCVTHYSSSGKADSSRTAINFRLADNLANLHIRYFDGADSWQTLDECEVRKV
ncbi:aldehyde-activating protein [Vibrio sp. SCSIO 43140]|uniref:GFA family protein n=1 Tax=Vibrio sp. SCSIO 43140 TaxID=2819100 RepID=UPI002074E706|nr:aldehyde-activating protein [Vibrio sp. SCSIO 43140]USD61851.1 aldehyde-activating protein [Vibrio sp. SCSIO 43140]